MKKLIKQIIKIRYNIYKNMDSVAKLLAKMPSTSPCPLGPSCGIPPKKGRALLLHTAVPKVLQEFLPEFRSSLDACQKKKSAVPRSAGPQRHGGGLGRRPLGYAAPGYACRWAC